jgi:hypothetical protein
LGAIESRRRNGIDWKLTGWFEIERFAIVSGSWANSDGTAEESWEELPPEVED